MELAVTLVAHDGSTTFVDGRCTEGRVRVGAVFDRLVRVDYEAGSEQEVARVRLEILAINAYGKELAEIEPSQTARLTVRGTATELLFQHCVLRGPS